MNNEKYLFTKAELVKFNKDNSRASTRTFEEVTADWLILNNKTPVSTFSEEKIRKIIFACASIECIPIESTKEGKEPETFSYTFSLTEMEKKVSQLSNLSKPSGEVSDVHRNYVEWEKEYYNKRGNE